MQLKIRDKIHLGKKVTPCDSIGNSKVIDSVAPDFNNADQKVEKIKRLAEKGQCDEMLLDTFQVF